MNVYDQDCLLPSITCGSVHGGFKSPDEKRVQWGEVFLIKKTQRKMRDPHFKILSNPFDELCQFTFACGLRPTLSLSPAESDIIYSATMRIDSH